MAMIDQFGFKKKNPTNKQILQTDTTKKIKSLWKLWVLQRFYESERKKMIKNFIDFPFFFFFWLACTIHKIILITNECSSKSSKNYPRRRVIAEHFSDGNTLLLPLFIKIERVRGGWKIWVRLTTLCMWPTVVEGTPKAPFFSSYYTEVESRVLLLSLDCSTYP